MDTETKNQIIPREKRFEVADLTGFDAIVSRADAEEDLFFAQLIDFSRTGVKFTVPFFAKFDEFLIIEFKFKNSSLHYIGTGRVRHIRNVEPNRWQVGCSIDPPVPDDVVAYMVKTTNQERRRFERVEVEGHGSLLRQGTIAGCDANLINVSEGGLCLSVDQEHETGQRVDFRIENQKGDEEIIAARVRWQSSVDGGFRLGCSFADSTSHTKLVDCLVEKQQAAAGDRVNWLVAAAIVVAMFLPPATYFLFGSRSDQSPTDNVAQLAVASPQSASELPDSFQPKSIPVLDKALATRTNDNHDQQDSGKLPTNNTQKSAASNAPAIPPTSRLHEEIIAKLASGKRDPNQEPDFRQPWGKPPADLAPSNNKSGTAKSETAKSEISNPSASQSEISSPLPIDPRSQPKPPQELLVSGPNKVRVIQGQSPEKSETLSNSKVAPKMNSKAPPSFTAVTQPDEASSRRLQATHSLLVPSEVISDQRSGH